MNAATTALAAGGERDEEGAMHVPAFLAVVWRWLTSLWSMVAGASGGSRELLAFPSSRSVRVVKRLAEGGFAFVDLVEDVATKERFALKRLLCQTNDQMDEAMHEVGVMGQLASCSHIASLIDWTTLVEAASATRTVCVLMPFYANGSLLQELERRRATQVWPDEPDLLARFRIVCLAVQHMHRQAPPLAHRDIKPGNVLVDDRGDPVLTDFGSTCEARQVVRTRHEARRIREHAEAYSTVSYRAPELFHAAIGATIDERTDVFSLGCLLYAMMYGQSPLDEVLDQGGSVALALAGGTIATKHRPAGRYGASVCHLVDRMLKYDAPSRPSVLAVLQAIDKIRRRASGTFAIEIDAASH